MEFYQLIAIAMSVPLGYREITQILSWIIGRTVLMNRADIIIVICVLLTGAVRAVRLLYGLSQTSTSSSTIHGY